MTSQKGPEGFRTRQEIADYLGFSRMTISRWERKARIGPVKGWGHTNWVTLERVREWLEELRGLGIIVYEQSSAYDRKF